METGSTFIQETAAKLRNDIEAEGTNTFQVVSKGFEAFPDPAGDFGATTCCGGGGYSGPFRRVESGARPAGPEKKVSRPLRKDRDIEESGSGIRVVPAFLVTTLPHVSPLRLTALGADSADFSAT